MKLFIVLLLLFVGCSTTQRHPPRQFTLPSIRSTDAASLLYEFASKVQTINFTNWEQFDSFTDSYMHNLKPFESEQGIRIINQCHLFVRTFSAYGQSSGYYPNTMIRSKLKDQVIANVIALSE